MKLLYINPLADPHLTPLEDRLLPQWQVTRRPSLAPGEDLAGLLAEAEALIAMRVPAGLPAAPRLKLLQLPGAGYDHIHPEILPPDCLVCNVFEHEFAIAEYVLAAMLNVTVQLGRMDRELRQGDWRSGLLHSGRAHSELRGKTLGLVGFGHIGRRIAKLATAFDMRILTVTRRPEQAGNEVAWAGSLADLGGVLGEADFLVLCCPLNDSTRGLIDAGAFAAMKTESHLINVARGEIVEEAALFAACRDRHIAGATIDVWYDYPSQAGDRVAPSRFPFHELDNVVMTPHASGWTDALWGRRLEVIAENLNRLLHGEAPVNQIARTDLG